MSFNANLHVSFLSWLCANEKGLWTFKRAFHYSLTTYKCMGSGLPQKIALKVTWMYSFWLKGRPFFLASSILWLSVVRIANNCGIYYQLWWGLGHSLCTRVKVKRILSCDSMCDLKLHLNGYSPSSLEIRFERAQIHSHMCTLCPSYIKLPEGPQMFQLFICLFCLCPLYIFSHSETSFSS